jgi:oligopeptide/dipeptide ABC transporter ATP-binding protein
MHPYGRALLSSVLAPDPEQIGTRLTLTGEIPSPVRKPSGCPLVGRCPIEIAGCATRAPALEDIGNGHLVACHRVSDVLAAGSIEALVRAQERLQAEGAAQQ